MLRTAALYVVGGWVVMQAGDVIFPALDIPEQALRYVLLALLAGFPVALVFGWFFDIGPEGIHRTHALGPGDEAVPQPLRGSDYAILAALAAVIGVIVFRTVGSVVDGPEAPIAVLPAERSGPPMVAVLPFTTASLEGDDPFFASGVHDDLLTQLSKLQSIRVISRTSVLEYQGTTRNLREIGAVLGADVIMEGGVQIAGERIRINAQLIDARTDAHLWAHTYDRELTPTNIFEVQSEIARAIAVATRTTLSPREAGQLALVPTDNMAAYRAFRRAMDMAEEGSVYRRPEYREALEEAVALDPGFTRAWAELAGHLSYINFWGEPDPADIARAEEILGTLRGLAPDSVEYLIALAYYTLYTLKDYDKAFEVITLAEEKAPSDLKILEMKTWIMRRQGRHAERIPVFRKILSLNPRSETAAYSVVGSLTTLHRYDEAAEELAELSFDGSEFAFLRNLLQLRADGDFNRYASRNVELAREFRDELRPGEVWEAYVAARQLEAAEAMLEELHDPRMEGLPGVPLATASALITYRFLGETGAFGEALQRALDHLESTGTVEQAAQTSTLYLDLALAAAMQGDTEETARLTRQWRRAAAASDATELIMGWPYACRSLGMAGAAAAPDAAECIRSGAREPSSVHPFLEPHLPYYDPVRATPEFQALLAELGLSGGA